MKPDLLKAIYKELMDATPEELLEVAKEHYIYRSEYLNSIGTPNPEYLMDIAFKIGKGIGWGCIAPDWLREYRENIKEAEDRTKRTPIEAPQMPREEK